jgi:hypothetical protein
MAIRYAVDLTDTERATLRELISKNKAKRSTISNSNFGFAGSLRLPIDPALATVGFPLKPRRQR